jgi:XTP/dITP diphosphohydrolase
MKLLIATRNPHKLAEIREILRAPGLELVGLRDGEGLPEVVEDGDTFAANAIKKAATLAQASGRWTLADDSGLEVDALGGAPGVRSARYAGAQGDAAANNAKLLRELGGATDRRARFRCAIALASPTGRARTVDGRCEGRIIREPRGKEGFGYDPLFVPDGHAQTFAEMRSEVKHALSHRGQALRRAAEAWGPILAAMPPDWPDRP